MTGKMLVENVQELVEAFYPPNTRLRMGQIMWPAVDENEKTSYGKSIEKTKLKPVFVDMITPESIEAVLQGAKTKNIRQSATVRLFKQAKQQGGVLTGVDVASMMRLHPNTISKYVRQWEKDHQETVPRRGTIHDMGRSITPKKQICYKVVVQGKSISTPARETGYSPGAINTVRQGLQENPCPRPVKLWAMGGDAPGGGSGQGCLCLIGTPAKFHFERRRGIILFQSDHLLTPDNRPLSNSSLVSGSCEVGQF